MAAFDDASIRRRKKHGRLEEDQRQLGETAVFSRSTSTSPPVHSSSISALLALSNLLTPYVLRPLTALQIYLPTMWPFSSTPFDPATGIPSLEGKVILVTGGNVGLGQETILQLAKHRPSRIYMASRTESKALAAIKEIKAQLPASSSDVDIEFLSLDLSSLTSVAAAAAKFESQNQRLDLLILNAGIMATPPGRSESGHDDQLGTNHIGHFLLTKLLLPTLAQTAASPGADVRVVSVSSEAFHMAPALDVITDTARLTARGPWTRYGASKAANILFAAELARRHGAVKAVSLHPGLIRTQLYAPSDASGGPLLRAAVATLGPWFFTDVARGAHNQLWAAAGSARAELQDGAYYTPVGRVQSNKWADDVAGGKRLWEWTEGELAKAGY